MFCCPLIVACRLLVSIVYCVLIVVCDFLFAVYRLLCDVSCAVCVVA